MFMWIGKFGYSLLAILCWIFPVPYIGYSLLAIPHWVFPICLVIVWGATVDSTWSWSGASPREPTAPMSPTTSQTINGAQEGIPSYSPQEGPPQGNRQGNIIAL